MAAAAAAEAPSPGGRTFAFSESAGAADDFRQAPQRSGESFTIPGAAPPVTAAATREGVFPTSEAAACTVPSGSVPNSLTAAAPAGGAASTVSASSATTPAATSPSVPSAASATASAAGAPVPALPLIPGETALLEYRKLGRKCRDKGLTDFFMPTMAEEDLDQFGWQEALRITEEPGPSTLPIEALSHRPTPDEIHKFFFKGTPHEVCIRQIFFHVPLSIDEQQWLQDFRRKCSSCNWAIPFFLEPHVLRLVWFCKRKYPQDSINKSLEHAQLMVEWRRQLYPICDSETELRKLLDMGVMYWVGRDASLRPLLIVRLSRLPKTTPPELFKRLTIFCFEWSLRFLMVPGVVETCVVLFDVRTVPLHQFPLSALTDMVTTLTKQFPFRLHKMWIINDSFFVQTAWNIVKQFLTDVQQQKIRFYRTGFETELLKEYALHQLEQHYGGTRELTVFYPFPMAPGPYTVTAEAPRPSKSPAVAPWKASDRFTTFGVVWENDCRVPPQWKGGEVAAEVFRAAGLRPPPAPITLEDEKTAKALEFVEKATLAQRTSCIRSYKSMVQRLSTLGGKRSTVWPGGGEESVGSSTLALEEPQKRETFGLVGSEMSKRLSTVEYTSAVSEAGADGLTGSAFVAQMTTEKIVTTKNAARDTTKESGGERDINACAAGAEPASATTNLSTHGSFPPAADTASGMRAQDDVTGGGGAPTQTHAPELPVKQRSKEAPVRENNL